MCCPRLTVYYLCVPVLFIMASILPYFYGKELLKILLTDWLNFYTIVLRPSILPCPCYAYLSKINLTRFPFVFSFLDTIFVSLVWFYPALI